MAVADVSCGRCRGKGSYDATVFHREALTDGRGYRRAQALRDRYGFSASAADDPSAVKGRPAIRDHTTSATSPSLVCDAAVKYPHGPAAYLDEPHTAGRPCLDHDQERRLFGTRTLDDIAVDARDVVADSPMRNNKNISRDWPPTFSPLPQRANALEAGEEVVL